MTAPALFHVHLTVKVSAAGAHVGRITAEPLPEQQAVEIKDAYAGKIFNEDSVTLAAVEYGKNDTLVVPIDVLRRSVLLFELKEIPVCNPMEELDFGQNSRKHRHLPADREV